ncbi:MAG: DUF4492 domain-containing protein [Muribaculaceae bacterium]|nr:DUF4492 domain-containing protein [Muribaculaceae bacterium]
MGSIASKARKVLDFYVDGFRNMTVGKKLWAIIFIKVIILFFVFKLFFFPDLLKENYDNDDDRARAVAEQLTTR